MCVQVLLDSPAVEVGHVNAAGKTALHLAASCGEHTLVAPLVAAGVPLNASDAAGNTAVIAAAAAAHERFATELLSDARADASARGDVRRTCLHWAGQRGMARLATSLLRRSDVDRDAADAHGDTAAILAAKSEHALVARLMLDAGCDAAVRGENGRTVAHWAAVHGMRDVMETAAPLLSRDALNAADDEGNTPLLCSAISRRYCVMLFLLQACADVDSSARGQQGRTALHWVCADGALDIVRLLLGRGMENARDDSGDTPLVLACRHGHESVARELVIASSVNEKGRGGRCALHEASAIGLRSTVQLLLTRAADVNAADSDANTPLLLAAKAGRDDIATLLIRAGCDVNARGAGGSTALCAVADRGSVGIVRLLLDSGARPDADESGEPPLIRAARRGHWSVVQALLGHGASTGRADRHGRTALLWAAQGGHVDVIKALIARGADW